MPPVCCSRFAPAIRCAMLWLAITSAGSAQQPSPSFERPPIWARQAIWYQIFVERFRNGDPTNDPRPQYMKGAYPSVLPPNWAVTPWGHDWYELDRWAKASGGDFYDLIAARRYGGDLQGVLDKLDYLQQLGVTAI